MSSVLSTVAFVKSVSGSNILNGVAPSWGSLDILSFDFGCIKVDRWVQKVKSLEPKCLERIDVIEECLVKKSM